MRHDRMVELVELMLKLHNGGRRVEDHFVDVTEMIEIGKRVQRTARTIFLSRFAPVLFLLLLARAPAQQMPLLGASPNNTPGFGLVAGEVGGAVVAGSALGLGLGYVAVWAAGGPGDLFEGPILPGYARVGGIAVGYTAGSALGTWLVGSMAQQDHVGSWAFVGALAGLPVSLGLVYAAAELEKNDKPGALLLIPAFAAPPAGAVIGYNLSPPCGCTQTTQLENRLLLPTIGLRRAAGDNETVVALDMKILNVRF
jgi:hypothetical protein